MQEEQEYKALIQGQPVTSLPQDLYIPPNALEIFLDAFEGPLDLLLYLIKKQNLDILDIPVAEITKQYVQYVDLMREHKLELAAEYMLMAGMLAQIKSRMLLPRPKELESEDDPRAELIKRLQEYELFKIAAEKLNDLPRINRDIFPTSSVDCDISRTKPLPDIELKDLWFALQDVLTRAKMYTTHHVQKEALSTRERMVKILTQLNDKNFGDFVDFFDPTEGRAGVIVTFSAILELLKQKIIEIVQTQPFGGIHVKKTR